jgi:hypothetical protein
MSLLLVNDLFLWWTIEITIANFCCLLKIWKAKDFTEVGVISND